ncbi:ABC transporter substrate-binding protein [Mycolicibacterium nivoides]|uniref:ABC transporter substrate-binding protein n=1 Tax=Mycolicibacterium nivoides TaxID=2487344 RepID=UPI003C303A4E
MNKYFSTDSDAVAPQWSGPVRIAPSRRTFLRGALGTVAAMGFGAPLMAACGPKPSSSPAPQSTIAAGLQPEAGPLRIFNYADYIAPDLITKFQDENKVKIEVTTFANEQEGLNKLANKAVNVDVYQAASESATTRLIRGGLIQPLNRTYLPNFGNLIKAYQDPSYDPGAKYSLPFAAWSMGIGYRTDRIAPEEIDAKGWDILRDERFRGQTAVVDSYRNTLGFEMLRRGEDVNSSDDAVINQALQDLLELADRVNVKVNVTQYQDIPEGGTTVSLAWCGDMLGSPAYLPQGTPVEVLGWWSPADDRTIIGTDSMAITAMATNPVLGHMWMNFLLQPENARIQFLNNGYQIPITGLDPGRLAADAGIPPMLAKAIYTESNANNGFRQKELDVDVDRKWEAAWSTFKSR